MNDAKMNEVQIWWKSLSPKEKGDWINRMYGFRKNFEAFVALDQLSDRINRLKLLTAQMQPIAMVLDVAINDLERP